VRALPAVVGLIVATALATWAPAASAAAESHVPLARAQARAVQAATPLGPPTWSDEFDGSSLDLTRWSYRATGPRFDGNLTPDAVSVGGGVLTIKTYTEGGQHYSGMISTQQHGSTGFEQAYGTFEARVKFNSSPGQWSAFWLQSPTIGSPLGDPATAGVETDIAEHRARCETVPSPRSPAPCAAGDDISNRTQRALIWDGYGADRKAAVQLSDPLEGFGNDSWHTFAVRWTPTEMTFYYDATAIWSTSGPISRRSQYIILSSEVGTFFAGAIPAGGYGSRETSRTSMQVDYVRVWAAAPDDFPTTGASSPAPIDTTAPNARLFTPSSQKLRANVVVSVSCPDEPCRATATGTIRIPRLGHARATTYRPSAATTSIARGMRVPVRLRLSSHARAAIMRALRADKRIVLKLGIRVADSAGNVQPRTRQVTLKR
jgi:beta-glucanase (GH16 family)